MSHRVVSCPRSLRTLAAAAVVLALTASAVARSEARTVVLGVGRITIEYDGTEAAFYLARYLKERAPETACGRLVPKLVDYPADAELAVFGRITGKIVSLGKQGFMAGLVGQLTLRNNAARSTLVATSTAKLAGPHVSVRAALQPIFDKVVEAAKKLIEGSCRVGG